MCGEGLPLEDTTKFQAHFSNLQPWHGLLPAWLVDCKHGPKSLELGLGNFEHGLPTMSMAWAA